LQKPNAGQQPRKLMKLLYKNEQTKDRILWRFALYLLNNWK